MARHRGGGALLIVNIEETCFRCGRRASNTLKIEAVVDNRRLKLAEDARDTAICSHCMIELAEWVKAGRLAAAEAGEAAQILDVELSGRVRGASGR
jgi:hypothetical protein